MASAERRFGVDRTAMAPKTVFVSHETYTPARGGSAAAEITALRAGLRRRRRTAIIVANTKGFTGHPMGVGIEDVIGVKILEHQIVPPVPNLKEPDPDLGTLTLSKGGRYAVEYAIHLAAGFGSQIALTLTRRIPGALDRVDDRARYERWLADVSGQRTARDRGREARAAREVVAAARATRRRRARGGSASGRCGGWSCPATRARESPEGRRACGPAPAAALAGSARVRRPLPPAFRRRRQRTGPVPRRIPASARRRTGAPRNDVVGRRSSRSSPRRPATRRTCWRWTSTSRPTSASTP